MLQHLFCCVNLQLRYLFPLPRNLRKFLIIKWLPYHRHNSICTENSQSHILHSTGISGTPFFLTGSFVANFSLPRTYPSSFTQTFAFCSVYPSPRNSTKFSIKRLSFNRFFEIHNLHLHRSFQFCCQSIHSQEPVYRHFLQHFCIGDLPIATKKPQQNSQWNVCHSTENPLLHLHRKLGRAFVTDWVITLKYLFGTVIWSFTNYFQ